MFQNWGFLITEIFFLLLLAALLGLLAGWLIWGRGCKKCKTNETSNHNVGKTAAVATGATATAAATSKAITPADHANVDYDGDGVIEGENEGSKPATLTAARGGKADDLKMIKGVGPKMETMLHGMGFFHFDQVAAWSKDELAWVDANLDGFHGRASRDEWVKQAKILAAGGDTEFSKRVEKGSVY